MERRQHSCCWHLQHVDGTLSPHATQISPSWHSILSSSFAGQHVGCSGETECLCYKEKCCCKPGVDCYMQSDWQ